MRVNQLHIEGFGTLSSVDFTFDPHLTVVYGDNERGKTTIKDAICATIFGFENIDDKRKYQPWNASVYAAAVTLSVNGTIYKIERNFDTDYVTISNMKNNDIIFQGSANPRGRSADQEQYFDFVKTHIGFSTPDIFQLTTLVEQTKTKTEISQKLRQLISGSKKADYTKVVKKMEEELEDITRDIPWKNLRKKREIEDIEEQIRLMGYKIDDARLNLEEACQLEDSVKNTIEKIKSLENELYTKKKELESLKNYIQTTEKISESQKNLRVLTDQSETIEELKTKIPQQPVTPSLQKYIPVAVGGAGGVVSVILWLIWGNILLAMVFAVVCLVLAGIYYLYTTKGQGTARDHIEKGEDIKETKKELREKIFELQNYKDGILDKYPAFGSADMDTLFNFQKNIDQDLEYLEKEIKDKKSKLENFRVDLGIYQQKTEDFRQWEYEKKRLTEKLKTLKKRKKALITAIFILKECIKEYQNKHIKEMQSYITGAFKKITNGKYTSVILEKNTFEPMVSTESQARISKENLSIGALEQLYFAMRLSMAYLLSQNVQLPFLLDDSFVSYDYNRLQNIKYILSRVKHTNQIILFVHDSSYKEWADHVIDLNERI
ncbi:MAG: AAA family ATPase [Candidatus Methanofastidiosia archaeon]|jgi:uncharacterized protein YhaN